MKKILFAMTLAAFAGTSMAQNSAISKARRIFDESAKTVEYKENKIIKTRVEIDWNKVQEAQDVLTPAFDNPKTKDLVGAWRLQGDINNRYLTNEVNKAAANEPLDTALFYKMVGGTLDAYYKVIELDKDGVQKELVKPFFQGYRTYYYYAGAFFDQNGDRAKAYEAFKQWIDYPKTYALVGEDYLDSSAGNVNPNQVAFYASLSAYNAKMYDKLDGLKEMSYGYEEQGDVARSLVLASLQAKGDTLAWINESENLIFDGTAPDGTMQNLLLYYWQSEQKDKLKELALKVCETRPDEQWGPYAMGIVAQEEAVQASTVEAWEECGNWFKKALEVNPEFTEALKGVGLSYYQRALVVYTDLPTSYKTDAARDAAEKPVKDMCREAATYFEQVRDLVPDKVEQWALNLIQIYSILGEKDKVVELKAIAGVEDED